MPREEAETLRLFAQQHRRKVAVPEPDFALVGDGAGDAERLQPFADRLRGIGGFGAALLDGDRGAQRVCPARVLDAMGCTLLTMSYASNPFSLQMRFASSKSLMPYFFMTGSICLILLS